LYYSNDVDLPECDQKNKQVINNGVEMFTDPSYRYDEGLAWMKYAAVLLHPTTNSTTNKSVLSTAEEFVSTCAE